SERSAFVDLLVLALDRRPDSVGREEHHRLLLAPEGGVRDHESDRGFVPVLLAVRDRNAKLVAHRILLSCVCLRPVSAPCPESGSCARYRNLSAFGFLACLFALLPASVPRCWFAVILI